MLRKETANNGLIKETEPIQSELTQSEPTQTDPTPTDNDEIFIFVGIHNYTYYFMHTINYSAYDISIAYQIYNCLIHHKIIINPTYDIIIYDILENNLNIIKIVHDLNPTKNRCFDPNIFYKLANDKYNSTNSDQLIIKYSYNNKYYSLYKFDTLEINNLFNIPFIELDIEHIQSVICLKPFD